jgi:hypothetical protein
LSTFPGGFIDQVVGTALLVGVILGITDSRNSPAPAGLALWSSVSWWCSSARRWFQLRVCDQRLAISDRVSSHSSPAGWRSLSAGNNWWWVPIVAPCVGGVLGDDLRHMRGQMAHALAMIGCERPPFRETEASHCHKRTVVWYSRPLRQSLSPCLRARQPRSIVACCSFA